MARGHLLDGHRIVEFHAQGDYGVFLAVIDPGRGIGLARLHGHDIVFECLRVGVLRCAPAETLSSS
jgi:hypothetical protein